MHFCVWSNLTPRGDIANLAGGNALHQKCGYEMGRRFILFFPKDCESRLSVA